MARQVVERIPIALPLELSTCIAVRVRYGSYIAAIYQVPDMRGHFVKIDKMTPAFAEANIRIFPKPGFDEKGAALLAIKKLAGTAGLDLSKPLSQLMSSRTVMGDEDIDREMEMYAKAIWEAFRRNLVIDLKGNPDCRKNL